MPHITCSDRKPIRLTALTPPVILPARGPRLDAAYTRLYRKPIERRRGLTDPVGLALGSVVLLGRNKAVTGGFREA